jgi:hypothetical protein
MVARRFRFRFTSTFQLAALPFAITPGRCEVLLDQDTFVARFGPWRVRTGRDNIASAELVGPFSLLKVAGPPRLSLADGGLTFASNPDRGVCVRFRRPVTGIDPTGFLQHPGLTVTVADCVALRNALAEENPRARTKGS